MRPSCLSYVMLLSNNVTVVFVSIVDSVEINRRQYFLSNLHTSVTTIGSALLVYTQPFPHHQHF